VLISKEVERHPQARPVEKKTPNPVLIGLGAGLFCDLPHGQIKLLW